MYNYLFKDMSLAVVSTETNLSITFDRELNFHGHIEKSEINNSQIERMQQKFLNFIARILHIVHRQHDYEPVLIKFELATLAIRRISASQDFSKKLVDDVCLQMSIDCPDLLCELNSKVLNFSLDYHIPSQFVPLIIRILDLFSKSILNAKNYVI